MDDSAIGLDWSGMDKRFKVLSFYITYFFSYLRIFILRNDIFIRR